MDPVTQYFNELKKLSVTLETETKKLQQAFDSQLRNDPDGGKGIRSSHGLNSDIEKLKPNARDDVISFIQACRLLQQKFSEDIQSVREQWEKYSHQASQGPRSPNIAEGQESESEEEEAADESDVRSGEEGEVLQEESDGSDVSSAPKERPAVFADILRTPQLSDFGLSEMQLKRALAGEEWCAEVPPMPKMHLSNPALDTPSPPPILNKHSPPTMPVTPKCALRMDDDELQTPRMQSFSISEHTMCLLNDFTINLFQKTVEKSPRPTLDIPGPPAISVIASCQAKADKLESPLPPVFCTPGFKIKKTTSRSPPPGQSNGFPKSPDLPKNLSATPDPPAFQTPYLSQMVSTKKSARHPEPVTKGTDADSDALQHQTPPSNGTTSAKQSWKSCCPDILAMDENEMPEMPNFESVLGNSLHIRSAKNVIKTNEHEKVMREATVNRLELDGPTQEFSLGTPRLRKDFHLPSTPEMPDLSSVTQDICKLLSQARLKNTDAIAVHHKTRPEKEKNSSLSTAVTVPVVSKSEFQSLPSYLRQMTLQSLNQAIHNINKFITEGPGEKMEFQMEELRKITKVGTKTPVYILCLTELKRLKHVGGTKNTSPLLGHHFGSQSSQQTAEHTSTFFCGLTMVHTCVVAGCRNRRTPGTTLSFYRFPRDPERKQRWIAAVNREGWVPNDGSRLCSTHFISEMKEPLEILDKQEARVEAANALLFLQGQGRSAAAEHGQKEQPMEKEQEAVVEESASSSLSSDEDDDEDDESMSDSKKGRLAQTSDASVNFDDILKALKKENQSLRESVEKMSLSESSLRNDAEKVRFYTGLPNYFVLETVMWLLAPHMEGMKNVKLSKFQQLLLTLMRLRLDLRNQDLAYRFGVKVGTVTRTVHQMVSIMSSTLVPTAVFWPSRAELRKNLPAALRTSHPDCAVIVDCFTVPFEEPVSRGNQQQQQRVVSSSQGMRTSSNVLKYLIGVAPQGVVTFVSRGVQGHVSDKSLAEGCGLLCKLLPGDVVLASRDLDIADSVAARGALFKIAGSFQGEAYGGLESSHPADTTSETASVQRHVDRVISMVKQRYAMLTGPVESPFTTASERTSNLSTFDKIVQVACALNNLCISAAPLE
ncbi:uncharacterized protein V6R79_011703 [Siganus canaliculatus]